MSCLTRTQIETSIDSAFNDLITNTALACEQMNTEGKHDLWMMAGRINLSYSGGTNTLSWKTSSDRTINAGTLSFTGSSPKQIKIDYPSQFSTGGKLPRPISVMALPSTALISYQSGAADAGYKLATTADAASTNIAASRDMMLSGVIGYSPASSSWYSYAASPLPSNTLNGITCSYNSTTGAATFQFPFKLKGTLPQLTPMAPNGFMYIPFIEEVDDTHIRVYFWDAINKLKLTGPISTDIQFNIYLGNINQLVDLQTTDLTNYGDIWFCGIYQSA